jgi:twitching motility protein PilT
MNVMGTYTSMIDAWLELVWHEKGSDLLLSTGSPPRIRVDGALIQLSEPILTSAAIEEVIGILLPSSLKTEYEERMDADFSFSWGDRARIRANAYNQRDGAALALRMIPMAIPTVEALGLPSTLLKLAELPRGLVLMTGPSGSGKSTTLAALIAHIGATRPVHIITIEDPIEYVHHHNLALIDQRGVGVNTPSFAHALRAVLREDPDVILVGEMRDPDSIQLALTLAETGHLVFATLHTHDASRAIDRVVDVFPSGTKELIRIQLAGSLQAVVAQRLIPKIGGGRVPAVEILWANLAVRSLIREGKSHQIRNVIMTGQSAGMCTLEMSLSKLIQAGTIGYESALEVSLYPKELAAAAA